MNNIEILPEDAARLSLEEILAKKKATELKRQQLEAELKEIEAAEAREKHRLESLSRKQPQPLSKEGQAKLKELTERAEKLQAEIEDNFQQIIQKAIELRKVVSEGHALCKGTTSYFPVVYDIVSRLIKKELPSRLYAAWNKIIGFR